MFGLALPLFALLAAAPPALTWDEAMARAAELPPAAAVREGLDDRRRFDERLSGTGNPTVEVAGGARTLPGETVFTGEISAVQPVALSSRGAAARGAAAAEHRAAAAEIRQRLLEARLEVAEAFCALHGAQGALAAAVEEERLAESLLARAARARQAELFTAAELADLEAYLAEVRLARTGMEGEVHQRGLALARALRIPEAEGIRAAGELPEVALPPPETQRHLLASLDRLPGVAVEAARLRAARARQAEAESTSVPWLGVGARVVRDEPGEQAWFGLLSFEIPIFQRGQRERARLASEAAGAQAELAEARSEGARLAASALHEVEHTAQTLALVQGALLPAATRAAELHQLAFDAGEGTAVELLAARRALLQARARAHVAAAAHAAARSRLALLLDAVAEEGDHR